MNEIKRYDKELAEQLAQIHLPDENFAWAEMKKMLDEDEDDPVTIPFYRRFGCGLLGLAGLLLLSIGGWFYWQQTKKENIVQAADLPGGSNTGKVKTAAVVSNSTGLKDSTTASARKNDPGTIDTAPFLPLQQQEVLRDASINRVASNSKTTIQFRGPGFEENSTELPVNRRNNNQTLKGKTTVNIRPAIATGEETIITDETSGENSSYSDPVKVRAAIQIPAVDSVITAIKKDSSLIVKKDSPVINKKTEATPLQEKDPGKNSWLLGAGLTVYQPFSLDGESAVPYNRYGRKGNLSDYIPSAYFRVYRNKKWFIHTEFRYGAPQSVKPFYYKQDIMIDSSQSVIRSVYQLKKTYYHQVPLSFNYYILPGLSLGTGIMYNRFTAAVANQDVYKGNNGGAVDTLLSSGIVSDRDKNKFVKNHFQWNADVQYQWRRFSFGARYSRDINPYIKFTDFITGESVEKKAETFNIFIRYELWRRR